MGDLAYVCTFSWEQGQPARTQDAPTPGLAW